MKKNPMLSLFVRKVINKISKTVVQFHFHLFVGKYLTACFKILFNFNSDQEILALINLF